MRSIVGSLGTGQPSSRERGVLVCHGHGHEALPE
jgi:hypothetical protein